MIVSNNNFKKYKYILNRFIILNRFSEYFILLNISENTLVFMLVKYESYIIWHAEYENNIKKQ